METADEILLPVAPSRDRYREANEKKARLLGMPAGTAMARLRKSMMFHLVQQLHLANCFRCGLQIETVDD